MDFIRQQFDKLVVCAFLVLAAFLLLHLIHHSQDQANTNQAWGVVQFFLGLLGGLVTGRAIPKQDLAQVTKSATVTESQTVIPNPPAAP